MSTMDDSVIGGAPDISVVIPSFNSAKWLPSTLDALDLAAQAAGITASVIVVDDGSTDETAELLHHRRPTPNIRLSVVSQTNSGRFMARYNGAQTATSPFVLLLDARVLLHAESLRYLLERLAEPGACRAWNGHIEIDKDAPLSGRLWEVLTHIFWRGYLRDPRPMDITVENFDRMPKGTGVFAVDRVLFLAACKAAWPQADALLVSDDTALLRHLAHVTPIRIDPGFSATYRPRTTFSAFLKHTLDRGTLFVDSYAGTTLARSLALVALGAAPLLALSVALLALSSGLPGLALGVLGLSLLALLVPLVLGAICGAPRRALLAFGVLILPFGLAFWAGLVRGLVIHRGAFVRGSLRTDSPEGDR